MENTEECQQWELLLPITDYEENKVTSYWKSETMVWILKTSTTLYADLIPGYGKKLVFF